MNQKKIRSSREAAPLIINAKHNVAVIVPTADGSHGEILAGVRIGNHGAATDERVFAPIPFYTHDVDHTSIRINVRLAIEEKVDIIIAVGATISGIAKEVLRKESSKIPLICAMAGHPIRTGLIPRHNDPHSNLAVLNAELYDMNKALSFLCTALPTAKKILFPIPQGSTAWHNTYVDDVQRFCKKHNLTLMQVEDGCMHELFKKVEAQIDKADVLFIPEGNLLLDYYHSLGGLCNDTKTPFFTGLNCAIEEDAALGYAMSLIPLGARAAEYAAQILFDDVQAYDIPFTPFPDIRRPVMNVAIAKKQGIDVAAVRERCGDDLELYGEQEEADNK